MNSYVKICTAAALAPVILFILGCSDANDHSANSSGLEPQPQDPAEILSIFQPQVELPPQAGNISLVATFFNLASVGYEAQEYFLSGTASAFTNLSELTPDGQWQVEAGDTDEYKTRVVVYRPIDATAFSGTAIVEWLNVSAGFDSAPIWLASHVEIMRKGHAWVAVSAQKVGIEGQENSILPIKLHLKGTQPERYASLTHPGDGYAYDIFSQVAQALRQPDSVDLLGGLDLRRLIAAGQSQSAWTLATYINAIQPLYQAYDGFLLAGRPVMSWSQQSDGWVPGEPQGSAPLAWPPQTPIPTPAVVTIRQDIDAPVMMLQTETDVVALASFSLRQPDSSHFRLWEVAGTSHADLYTTVTGQFDTGSEPSIPVVTEESSVFGVINCDLPMNAGPLPWVLQRAVNALDIWVRRGEEPPTAQRLEVTTDGQTLLLDDIGNALGGIRTPYVDAPAALLSGLGQNSESFCSLFGTTALFDTATMASLYVDQTGYEQAVAAAADDAVAMGFLLPQDARRVKVAASLQWQALEQ
ncbi:MAG: alpha/beta hydrolase domain-containing protein [Halioglobus sp.]